MTPKDAKKTLLVSMILSALIVTIAAARKGDLPPPRRYLGMGTAFLITAFLIEAAPAVGAGLALLIAVSVLLKNGEEALAGLVGAQSPGRAFAASRASVVPPSISFGLFGSAELPGQIGEWGSSKAAVQAITANAKRSLRVESSKRATKATSTGAISDHWTGCKLCYAEDLVGTVGAMDSAAIGIARLLGKSYDGRSPLVFTTSRGGYRIQVLYRTMIGGNHFQHIHVGARKEGYEPR